MNRFTAHEHLFIQFYCLSDPTIANVHEFSPSDTDWSSLLNNLTIRFKSDRSWTFYFIDALTVNTSWEWLMQYSCNSHFNFSKKIPNEKKILWPMLILSIEFLLSLSPLRIFPLNLIHILILFPFPFIDHSHSSFHNHFFNIISSIFFYPFNN